MLIPIQQRPPYVKKCRICNFDNLYDSSNLFAGLVIQRSIFQTDPDKFEMVRHLQVKLRENRAVFDALFGANYNVVNTAKLYCPICGKLARLSATG